MTDQPSFFAELKRRNVYKIAVAYLVVSWLLIQAASILFPTFDAPASAMKILVVVLVIGFPIALGFSWAFEITPEGLKRESAIDPQGSIAQHTGRRIMALTIVLAVVAAGLLAWQLLGRPHGQTVGEAVSFPSKQEGKVTPSPAKEAGLGLHGDSTTGARPSIPIPEKSIAVLPFDNLSDDKANAYFAEGIQDEILTRLSKIASLKVISRSSTKKYKSAPENLRDVSQQLGVANVLEGSVQKIDNAVHVNVQLIRATTDEHLWAESYNRKLDDVFGVEAEVAGTIADQLKATLTGAEKQAINAASTTNSEAYDAYLRALALYRKDDVSNLSQTEKFATQATRLDPLFAQAWALLSRIHSGAFFEGGDATEKRRASAREAAATAARLQPDLAEVQVAQGYFQYYVERDYNPARIQFEKLLQKWPNNAEALEALGLILRRQGHWAEAITYMQKAVSLDPLSPSPKRNLSELYFFTRDFQEALRQIDQGLNIWPDNQSFLGDKALILMAEGKMEEAGAVVAAIRPSSSDYNTLVAVWNFADFQRNYLPGLKALEAVQRAGRENNMPQQESCILDLFIGNLRTGAGDLAGAHENYVHARNTALAMLKTQTDQSPIYDALGFIYAGLGEKDAALKSIDEAVKLMPATKDALQGIFWESDRALIQAKFGDAENAIPAFERLLKVPGYIKPAVLRLSSVCDPLRGNPRFVKLYQSN